MPFVSVTRLRVISILYLPAFMRANEASVRSMKGLQGFLGGSELIDRGLIFWTLTLWDDELSMKAFRNGQSHRSAMQRLPDWCDEASYIHWIQASDTLPDWATASSRLLEEGRLTKVKAPSVAQVLGRFPPLRWTRMARPLKA